MQKESTCKARAPYTCSSAISVALGTAQSLATGSPNFGTTQMVYQTAVCLTNIDPTAPQNLSPALRLPRQQTQSQGSSGNSLPSHTMQCTPVGTCCAIPAFTLDKQRGCAGKTSRGNEGSCGWHRPWQTPAGLRNREVTRVATKTSVAPSNRAWQRPRKAQASFVRTWHKAKLKARLFVFLFFYDAG